jgi:streptogramin lyase
MQRVVDMTFEIRELRRAGAHALRALALAGGLLVAFSASDRGAMAQLFNQFPLSTPSSVPQGITLGPDGALWFTETLNNKIGRITTAGVITEYTIPVASSSPQGITSGPDGSLWFTMFNANAIGSITTSGTFGPFYNPPRPTADWRGSPPGRTVRCDSPRTMPARSEESPHQAASPNSAWA